MTILVADISHYQTISKDLVGAAQAGIAGIIHKCTEGSSIIDKKALARHELTKEAGLLWGVYHYMRPGDMAAQAKWFYDNAHAMIDDHTLIAVDHEDAGVSIADLKLFMGYVRGRFNCTPILYTGSVLKEQLKEPDPELSIYPLWLAQHGNVPVLPKGFEHYWLWQYTSGAVIAGIQPHTDLSKYNGNQSELISDWYRYAAKQDITGSPPVQGGEKSIKITVPRGFRVDVEYV